MSRITALRVGTWNLLHGLAPDSGAVNGEALSGDVLALEAGHLDLDLLAIQEVDELQPRSGMRSQTEEIAKALQATDHHFLAAVEGTPGESWQPATHAGGGPQYGIGLISRLPVQQWHELRLPSAHSGMPLLVPTEKGPRLIYVSDEPRVAVAAQLEGLTIACTHLSFVPGRNIRQLRAVMRWLNRLPGPRLLVGDFNLPGGIPRRVTGWSALARAATYPAWKPRVQFDHILADRPWQVDSVSTPHLKVSDHRPLVVEIREQRTESGR